MPDMPLDTPASSAALRPLFGLEKFPMPNTPEDRMPLAPSWSAFWVVLMLWSVTAGLLVPDIPLEETGDIRRIATLAGLELVLLATPTTPEARMRAIAEVSQGFVYLVSVAGAPRALPGGFYTIGRHGQWQMLCRCCAALLRAIYHLIRHGCTKEIALKLMMT